MTDKTSESSQLPEIALPDSNTLFANALALQKWTCDQAPKQPDLFEVSQTANKFVSMYSKTLFLWAALQKAPRRNVAGRNSALEIIGGTWARSSAYKFLSDDLGLKTEAKMDEFVCARNMEEVIDVCAPLKDLAKHVQHSYERLVGQQELPIQYDDDRKQLNDGSTGNRWASSVNIGPGFINER